MELGKAATERVVLHLVEREIELPVDPEEAWEVIGDEEGLGEWLGGEAEIDMTPGGDLRIVLEDGERVGFVEEVRAAERLAFWWRRPEEDVSTRVEIALSQTRDGTLLRIVETSPLASLDLVGIPLPRREIGGSSTAQGPLALALA